MSQQLPRGTATASEALRMSAPLAISFRILKHIVGAAVFLDNDDDVLDGRGILALSRGQRNAGNQEQCALSCEFHKKNLSNASRELEMVSLASALKLSRGVRFRNEGHSPQGMLRSLAGTAPREAGRVSSSTQTGVTSMKLITSWCAIVADVQWEKRCHFKHGALAARYCFVFRLVAAYGRRSATSSSGGISNAKQSENAAHLEDRPAS